tara:strand:+ start:303 stop:434 length:132 start_codon:yes stop_codon:yes gene_type:complete
MADTGDVCVRERDPTSVANIDQVVARHLHIDVVTGIGYFFEKM